MSGGVVSGRLYSDWRRLKWAMHRASYPLLIRGLWVRGPRGPTKPRGQGHHDPDHQGRSPLFLPFPSLSLFRPTVPERPIQSSHGSRVPNLPPHVHALGHRGPGVSELIGDLPRALPRVIQDRVAKVLRRLCDLAHSRLATLA